MTQSIQFETLAVDFGGVHDKGEGFGIGLMDELQRLREHIAPRDSQDDLLLAARITADGRDYRRAAVGMCSSTFVTSSPRSVTV